MTINHVKGSDSSPVNPNVSSSAAQTGKTEKAAARQAANAYAKSSPPPTVSDAAQVRISPRAREMNEIKKIVDETPDVNEEKVAKFRNMIASGEYTPDGGKIADGILREAMRDKLSAHPEVALD